MALIDSTTTIDYESNPNEWNSKEHTKMFEEAFTDRVFPVFLNVLLLSYYVVAFTFLNERFNLLGRMFTRLNQFKFRGSTYIMHRLNEEFKRDFQERRKAFISFRSFKVACLISGITLAILLYLLKNSGADYNLGKNSVN